jgi:periplasmic protein CpxP/Spy
MRTVVLGMLAIAIISLGAAWASAHAFGGRTAGFFGMDENRRAQMFERMFNRVADELNLNDDQRTRAKGVLAESKVRVEPLLQEMKSTHQQIAELGKDGTFNEERVSQLAEQQAETMKQLIVEKERTKAQLFAILTPEQRQKAEELKERFKGKFRKGMEMGMMSNAF